MMDFFVFCCKDLVEELEGPVVDAWLPLSNHQCVRSLHGCQDCCHIVKIVKIVKIVRLSSSLHCCQDCRHISLLLKTFALSTMASSHSGLDCVRQPRENAAFASIHLWIVLLAQKLTTTKSQSVAG